jgi:hypothetical protein
MAAVLTWVQTPPAFRQIPAPSVATINTRCVPTCRTPIASGRAPCATVDRPSSVHPPVSEAAAEYTSPPVLPVEDPLATKTRGGAVRRYSTSKPVAPPPGRRWDTVSPPSEDERWTQSTIATESREGDVGSNATARAMLTPRPDTAGYHCVPPSVARQTPERPASNTCGRRHPPAGGDEGSSAIDDTV